MNVPTTQRIATISRSGRAAAALLGFVLALEASLCAQEPLKLSEDAARQAAVGKVQPSTPALAKNLKLSGTVTVEVTIDATGKVEQCRPLTGNPLLTAAAVTAVKQWSFRPFKSAGQATKATAPLTFAFE